MATTLTPKNPRLVSGGPMARLPNKIRAADGQTWKAGEWGYSASGVFTLCATDATAAQYVALENQLTATSSSDVVVGKITNSMVWEVYELDGVVDSANAGESYGIDVSNNILTLDEAEVTAKIFRVVDFANDYEPSRNAADDIKGRCWVQVLQTAIEA